MCLLPFPVEKRPFFCNSIVLLLSCINTYLIGLSPWASLKYLNQVHLGICSPEDTTSVSVELTVFKRSFLATFMIAQPNTNKWLSWGLVKERFLGPNKFATYWLGIGGNEDDDTTGIEESSDNGVGIQGSTPIPRSHRSLPNALYTISNSNDDRWKCNRFQIGLITITA